MRSAIVVCVGLAIITARCSKRPNAGVAQSDMSASVVAASEWVLVALGANQVPTEGRPITLRFDSVTMRASGFAPCNQFSATYTIARDSLSFGPVISTKMACMDNDRNQLEQKYLATLRSVTTYQVSDSTLTLGSAATALARFRSR
jgi:copper homeostasis protein (lipoprotein)